VIHVVDIQAPPGLTVLPEVLRRVLPEIAEAVRNEIVSYAQRELHTTGEDYVQGLQLLHVPLSPQNLRSGAREFASIVLVGQVPNMVEVGWEGGDMKEALLQGRNAKVSEDGTRYNTVPYRHFTPGSTGRSGQTMGSAYGPGRGGLSRSSGGPMTRADAEKLGRTVHREAKKLQATTSHASGGTTWGDRLRGGVGGAGLLRSHHKGDIHEGMVRKEKTYRKATQSSYMTFRRVSDNSDPAAWMHPGITGRHFFDRAAKRVDKIAGFIVGNAVRGAMRGP